VNDTAAEAAIDAALLLIALTPGYEAVASDLSGRRARGRVRIVPDLQDRAQATLSGVVLIGPEALEGGTLGLAQTLVHEAYHLRQFPLEKTASFWLGVATGKPVMRRYEAPAYQAALRFLETVAAAFSELASEAAHEAAAVRATFAACYGGPLDETS
jgi:hypothetical protein